jgi:pimeloyl-ACP methyl ester carboxylesterase
LARKTLLTSIVVLLAAVSLVQGCARIRETKAEEAYPPVGQILDIDGVKVHALVQGSGPDLVLIHGASGNLRDFTFKLSPLLTDRYRVIMFDRPGLGWTDELPQYEGAFNATASGPRAQAALMQKAADRLDVKNPIVLGHSFGGAVALAWGLERPDDTAALVLVSAVSEPWPGGLGPLYEILGSTLGGALAVPVITAFVPGNIVDASIKTIFAPQDVPTGYAEHVGAALTLRRPTMRTNAQQVNSLRPHIVEMSKDYQATLKMPIEVLHGDADTIVPLDIHAQVLVKQLDNAHLRVLPGLGHMPHQIEPDAVAAAIDRAASRAGLR